jgi:hypothetical protein
MAVAFMVIFFPIISGGPTRMVCTRVRLGPRSPRLELSSLRLKVCWHFNSERTHDQGDPPLEVTFDNAREHDGAGVPCVLQGMGILYFALAANFWWLALCINVFEMVFLGRSLHVVRKWHLFYHIFAWGAPLLGVIIVLAGTVRLTHQPHQPHQPTNLSHKKRCVGWCAVIRRAPGGPVLFRGRQRVVAVDHLLHSGRFVSDHRHHPHHRLCHPLRPGTHHSLSFSFSFSFAFAFFAFFAFCQLLAGVFVF